MCVSIRGDSNRNSQHMILWRNDVLKNIMLKPTQITPFLLYEPRYEKTGFCICENKDADQLRSNCTADQRLRFRYTDRRIPLLPRSEISPSSVAVQPGLCRIWSETPKTGFLTTRLIYKVHLRRRPREVAEWRSG